MRYGHRSDRPRSMRVLSAVADVYDIAPSQMLISTHERAIVVPRQVAWYLLRSMYRWSLPRCGRVVGSHHHTTVLHGIRNVQRMRDAMPDFARLLEQLEGTIRGAEAAAATEPLRRIGRMDELEARLAYGEALLKMDREKTA